MKGATAICAALLRRCTPQERGALLFYAPQEQQEILQHCGPFLGEPANKIATTAERLANIHPSWLEPVLRPLSTQKIGTMLAALDASMQEWLKKVLGWSGPLPMLRPLAITYMREQLFNKLAETQEDLLPVECLPEGGLNRLAQQKTQKLEELIQHLGLRELSFEMRQIIETAKLKRITQALSLDKQRLLKGFSLKKETVGFAKGTLAQWDGNKESLHRWIEQRGLNRLAKALFGLPSSLLWYVSHTLQREQGQLLMKLCSTVGSPKVVQVLREQIDEELKQ